MPAWLLAMLGFFPWLLDKWGCFTRKPKLRIVLGESQSLNWTVKVGDALNCSRVLVRNDGKVAAQGIQAVFRFPQSFIREVAQGTDSFGFPEEGALWKKYEQGGEVVLEFAGDKSVPPKDEVQIGNLRIPLRGGRVSSNQFRCIVKVSADNSPPVEKPLILTVERSS